MSSFTRYQLTGGDSNYDSSSSDGHHHRHHHHQHAPYPLKLTVESSPTGKLLSEIATTPEELGTCNHTCPGVRGCVHDDYFCDSIEDCPDGFDEKNCSRTKLQFKCLSNDNFFPFQSICDGTKDCDDESDEAGCPVQSNGCLENQFKCKSGTCIRRAFVCDAVDDCDGDEISDEINCPEARFVKTGTKPTRDESVIPFSIKPVPSTTKKTTTTKRPTIDTSTNDNDVAASDEITSRSTSTSSNKINPSIDKSTTWTSTSTVKIIDPTNVIDTTDSSEYDEIVNDSTVNVDSFLTSSSNKLIAASSQLILLLTTVITLLIP